MEDSKKFKIKRIITGVAEELTEYYKNNVDSSTNNGPEPKNKLPIVDSHRDWVFNYQLSNLLLDAGLVSPQNHKRCNRTGILGRKLREGTTDKYDRVLCGCIMNKSVKMLASLVENDPLNLPEGVVLRAPIKRDVMSFNNYRLYLGLNIYDNGEISKESEPSSENINGGL